MSVPQLVCPHCQAAIGTNAAPNGSGDFCRQCGAVFPQDGLLTQSLLEGNGTLPTIPPQPTTDHLEQPATLGLPIPVPLRTGPLPSVPGYELLAELGRGGMGVVYKARHIGLKRVVALKMILSGAHAGPSELTRFKSEAEAVARLQHPNIVQIYEVGEHEGKPFFSLEYCPGGSLDRKLTGNPLPPNEAAMLVETVARAMHAAHAAHVVHRDLKPANVLLTAENAPKITDFGLAKKLDEEGATSTGAVMGTPSYMAPEQAGGAKRVGPAADVYAMGAILYELLVGRPPFRGSTPTDTIILLLTEEPRPPREVCAAIPRDLEAICLKCLDKDPTGRYPTAAELVEDLTRFLAGEPVAASRSGWMSRLASSLERVQLHERFATHGTLLLALIPVMFLPEVWVTIVTWNDWPGPLLALGPWGRVVAFLALFGYHRGWRWRPQGAAERQLWMVWAGYLLACFVYGFSSRLALGFATRLELKFYQALACLTAVAFFGLVSFWGYCAVIGAAFLALSFVMALDLRWAPLEFGAVWAAVLLLMGLRLRKLGKIGSEEPHKHPGQAGSPT